MSRGGKQIEGQLSFNFCIDKQNVVCQSNTLVGGKQTLKLNSAKLIRAAIMQVVRDDEELKPYIITIAELSKLLNVTPGNIYRDITDITKDICNHPVFIKEVSGKKVRWIAIPWVTRCEYNSDIGVAIKLNDELKPFLLSLKNSYTQYTLEDVLSMESVYSVRIYELLLSKIMIKKLPKEGIDVELSVDNIKECCGCDANKAYNTFSNFRNRVIDTAVNEINAKTIYRISYDYQKQGRAVVGLIFHVNVMYH